MSLTVPMRGDAKRSGNDTTAFELKRRHAPCMVDGRSNKMHATMLV
jgi:hypothetical protein